MKALEIYCPPQAIFVRMEDDDVICAASMNSYDGDKSGTIEGEESLSKENNSSCSRNVWGDEAW